MIGLAMGLVVMVVVEETRQGLRCPFMRRGVQDEATTTVLTGF